MGASKIQILDPPDVYIYHDMRQYLKDWMEYKKSMDSSYSLRELARQTQISAALLPAIFSNRRTLTRNILEKLLPVIQLSAPEAHFLELLRRVSEGRKQSERQAAYQQICKLGLYQGKNPKELQAHAYLSHWYYPAIRELAKLGEFTFDAKKVRAALGQKVTLSEVRDALQFLVKNDFIVKLPNGKAAVNEKQLDCVQGVYRLALAEQHKQLLSLAGESIDDVPREFRYLIGHMLSFQKNRLDLVKEIFDEALTKIKNLPIEDSQKDSVYQLSFYAFPLTKVNGDHDE